MCPKRHPPLLNVCRFARLLPKYLNSSLLWLWLISYITFSILLGRDSNSYLAYYPVTFDSNVGLFTLVCSCHVIIYGILWGDFTLFNFSLNWMFDCALVLLKIKYSHDNSFNKNSKNMNGEEFWVPTLKASRIGALFLLVYYGWYQKILETVQFWIFNGLYLFENSSQDK